MQLLANQITLGPAKIRSRRPGAVPVGARVYDNAGRPRLISQRQLGLCSTNAKSQIHYTNYHNNLFVLPSSVILFLRPFIARLIICICKPLLLSTLDACIPNRVKTPQ
jgi:hypothetical protein